MCSDSRTSIRVVYSVRYFELFGISKYHNNVEIQLYQFVYIYDVNF